MANKELPCFEKIHEPLIKNKLIYLPAWFYNTLKTEKQ